MGVLEKIDRMIEERRIEAEKADTISDLLNIFLSQISWETESDTYPLEVPIRGFKAPFDNDTLGSRQRFVCKNIYKKHIYIGVDGSQYTNEGFTKFATLIYGGVALHTLGEDGIYKSLKVAGVPSVTKPGDIDRERFTMEARIARCIGIKLKDEALLDCSYCDFKSSCEIRSFEEDFSDLEPVIFMDYPLETSWFKGFHEGEGLDSCIRAHSELLRFSNEEKVPLLGIVSTSRSRDLYTRILDEIQNRYLQGSANENTIRDVPKPITEAVLNWARSIDENYKLPIKKSSALEEFIKILSSTKNTIDDWWILRGFCPDIGDRTSAFRCMRKEIIEWYSHPINFFFVNTHPDWARISYTGCENPGEVYHHFLIQSAGMQFFYPFVLHRAHHEVAARPELRMLIENRISTLMNGALGSKDLSKKMSV
ncbi:MAG: DNA double-strand break repair nuclease NurA [Candidatus Hydrothermarchaeales archaeon]